MTEIVGTGIVKLSTNCIGYSKTIQLVPIKSYSFMIKSPLDINFDITVDDCCKKDIFNKSLPYLSPIPLNKINLESLRYATHEMDSLEQQLNNLEKESHFIRYGPYYSTFTYILIVCIFLYIFDKIYNYCKNKNLSSSGCCVQIYNHCYNSRKSKSKVSNSVEMTQVSSSSEDDKHSIQSLPNYNVYNRNFNF